LATRLLAGFPGREVAAAQFIDSCLSLTLKSTLFNFAGPPSDEQIRRVVRSAVRAIATAHKPLTACKN
jgi:hypothetical protein